MALFCPSLDTCHIWASTWHASSKIRFASKERASLAEHIRSIDTRPLSREKSVPLGDGIFFMAQSSPLGVARSASEASYTPKERCHPKVLLNLRGTLSTSKRPSQRFFLNVLIPAWSHLGAPKNILPLPLLSYTYRGLVLQQHDMLL